MRGVFWGGGEDEISFTKVGGMKFELLDGINNA
jgi:hypothetical protein